MEDKSVRDLISEDKPGKALQRIRQFLEDIKERENEYAIYNSRLQSYEKALRENTHAPGEADYQKNRLKNSILDFYDLLEKEILTFSSIKRIETTVESFENQLRRKLSRLYDIKEPLGAGGTSIIYKANEHSSNQLVAIRAFKNQDFSIVESREQDGENISAEMRKILQLKHRNIKKISGEFLGDFPACYTEDFIDGPTLNRILRNGPWPASEVREMLLQLADALYYLHSKKLIHLRLRPSKVFIDSEGVPIISPFEKFTFRFKTFGLDKARQELQYLSPEQLNEEEPDQRADQFSLGLIAYELLSGKVLFGGKTIPDIFRVRETFFTNTRVRNQTIKELHIPPAFARLMKKMLAKDPADRYSDMNALARDLINIRIPIHTAVEKVRDSYRRCRAANSCFSRDFYKNLLTEKTNEEGKKEQAEIQRIFDQAKNPDPTHREQMLKSAIRLLISSYADKNYLEKISRIEAHQAANPSHYKRFLAVLIKTAADNDYLWNEEIEDAWKEIADSAISRLAPNSS